MRKFNVLGLSVFGTVLFASTLACSMVTTKVSVDTTKQGQKISRSFYGSQMDSFSSPPPADLVKQLGVGQIRLGGNEYEVFNWKNNVAITNKSGQKTILGYEAAASAFKQYGTNGIFQINLLGVQPEFENGSYVLKTTFDTTAVYELIQQLNGKLKLGITDVCLGNEAEQWHETHPHMAALAGLYSADSGISADDYIQRYIAYAMAIRQAQESVTGDANSIKIWGPEISSSWLDWNTGNMTSDCEWSSEGGGRVICSYGNKKFDHFIPYFLSRLAAAEKDKALNPRGYKLMDTFSFHYYPMFRKKNADMNSIITDKNGLQAVGEMLEGTRILHDSTYVNVSDRSSYRKIKDKEDKNYQSNIIGRMQDWLKTYYPKAKLAINEFAFDSDFRSTNYHPIVRPLYTADAVAVAAVNGISFFNNFVLSSPEQSNIPWVLISEGKDKTNLYKTYALIANHFLGTVVNTTDDAGDVINAYAVDAGTTLNILVVNKSPADRSVEIISNAGTTAVIQKVADYKAPGWSVSILKLEKGKKYSGQTFQVIKFGADEMGIPKDQNYLTK
jgi:hypothetical protein